MDIPAKLTTATLLAYPLVAHLAVWRHSPSWLAGYLLVPGALLLLSAWRSETPTRAWPGLALLVIGGLLLRQPADTPWLFYLPPVLIVGALFWLFASSLAPGRQALITRIAERIDGVPPDAEKQRYTRRVTQVWSVFLAGMLVELVLLGLFASLEVWSWFANVINYVLLGLLLVGEFWVRRRRFGAARTGSLRTFLGRLIKCRQIWTIT